MLRQQCRRDLCKILLWLSNDYVWIITNQFLGFPISGCQYAILPRCNINFTENIEIKPIKYLIALASTVGGYISVWHFDPIKYPKKNITFPHFTSFGRYVTRFCRTDEYNACPAMLSWRWACQGHGKHGRWIWSVNVVTGIKHEQIANCLSREVVMKWNKYQRMYNLTSAAYVELFWYPGVEHERNDL